MISPGAIDPEFKDDNKELYPWNTSIGIIDWLENDTNLVAVLDGTSSERSASGEPHTPAYQNKALRNSRPLSDLLYAIDGSEEIENLTARQQEFCQWLDNQYLHSHNPLRENALFEGILWSTTVLSERWIILRGTPLPSGISTTHPGCQHTHDSENPDARRVSQDGSVTSRTKRIRKSTSDEELEITQYTLLNNAKPVVRCFMSEPLSAHQAFVRDFDWASTPVGPMSRWNSHLVDIVSLTLTSTDPAAVFWGDEMTSIYNESFITIAGQKHPAMMGDTPKKAFAEVWDQFFEPRIQLSRVTREPFCEEGLCLLLERRGYPEETFMTFTFLPLLDHTGEVVGFYHTVTEATQQILSQRRMSLLLSTSEVLSKAQNLRSFWTLLVESLSGSELDTPFAVLYSVSDQPELGSTDDIPDEHLRSAPETLVQVECHLEGHIGYHPEHNDLLDTFWLDQEDSVFASVFRSSMDSRTPKIISLEDGSLPPSMVTNLEKRGYSDQCNAFAICPLRPTNHDTALGFLAIGLSSRRPCDQDYSSFVNLLVKNISSSLASVVLLEDEKRRGINNAERAAYERIQLTAKLQKREVENQLQEHKFMLMAHQVPVAILDLTPDGHIQFCNQAWHDMTHHDKSDKSAMSWINVIHKDDLAMVQREWTTVSVQHLPVSFEARLKIPWQAEPDDSSSARLDATWSLAKMYPVVADDGSLVNVIGSVTDISFQKYATAQQIQRVEEAIEAKRQQENFIDMTSHEMRNPLNAMLLCAQDLFDTLQKATHNDDAYIFTAETLSHSIESVETIIYCGRHQKRIIDDVLTLSKLDAKLLQINPIEVEPISMVQDTLRLFDSEVRAQGIDVRLEIGEPMRSLGVVNVMLDPSRIVQILVNFIANAIKFTKTEVTRQMLISISASAGVPSASELASSRIQLIPNGGLFQDPTWGSNWGDGDPLYLQFVVRDTGPGISSADMMRLFSRFAQTLPKTHAHYGGSGLGLFISQQLAELQGGRVGISSEPGVGSSFYFYVKARHARISNISALSASHQGTKLAHKTPDHTPKSSPNVNIKHANPNATSVLVVEDNLVNQKVLKRQLEKLGYNVLVANHGEEALHIIQHSRIWNGDGMEEEMDTSTQQAHNLDVILMDIEMPVMDGRQCVQRIRALEQEERLCLHIPTIALTANARPEQINDARKYGFVSITILTFFSPIRGYFEC